MVERDACYVIDCERRKVGMHVMCDERSQFLRSFFIARGLDIHAGGVSIDVEKGQVFFFFCGDFDAGVESADPSGAKSTKTDDGIGVVFSVSS